MGEIAEKVEKLEVLLSRIIHTDRLDLENEIKNILHSEDVVVSCLQIYGKIIDLQDLTTAENFLCIKYGDLKCGTIFPFLREAHLIKGSEQTLYPVEQLFNNKGYKVKYSKNAGSPKDLINQIRKEHSG
jgi:hypothetical protein